MLTRGTPQSGLDLNRLGAGFRLAIGLRIDAITLEALTPESEIVRPAAFTPTVLEDRHGVFLTVTPIARRATIAASCTAESRFRRGLGWISAL
jgi:hypothetical protein